MNLLIQITEEIGYLQLLGLPFADVENVVEILVWTESLTVRYIFDKKTLTFDWYE